ncbi:hypothetical protein FJY93_02725 [Candidatus Kaiserbacteria bacterium]|nr:hypothetical protein [Candidatus Kaiserbacteria bacterium]
MEQVMFSRTLPHTLNPGFIVIVLFVLAGEIQHWIDGTDRTLTLILCLVFWFGFGLDTVSRAIAVRHTRVDQVGMLNMTRVCAQALLWGPFAHRIFRKR